MLKYIYFFPCSFLQDLLFCGFSLEWTIKKKVIKKWRIRIFFWRQLFNCSFEWISLPHNLINFFSREILFGIENEGELTGCGWFVENDKDLEHLFGRWGEKHFIYLDLIKRLPLGCIWQKALVKSIAEYLETLISFG